MLAHAVDRAVESQSWALDGSNPPLVDEGSDLGARFGEFRLAEVVRLFRLKSGGGFQGNGVFQERPSRSLRTGGKPGGGMLSQRKSLNSSLCEVCFVSLVHGWLWVGVASAICAVTVTLISAAAAVVGRLLLILRVSKLLALIITCCPALIRKYSLLLLLRGLGAYFRAFLDIWCNGVSLILTAEAHLSAQASTTTPPTSATPPGTTPPAAGLAFALYADHLPFCSSWCAPCTCSEGAQALCRCICCTEASTAEQTSSRCGCSQAAQSAPVPRA
jgi:hypothetical protein